MTRQRSFKRLVRARMDKTGESYTAARAVLLAGDDAPTTAADEQPPLVASDERITERTGRGWEAWFDLLDEWGADTMGHTAIARRVAAELAVDPLAWDVQAVTTSYERARGKRVVGQRAGGDFAASASKTINVPAEVVYAALATADRRARWLADDQLRERTVLPPRSLRFDWGDGPGRVLVTIDAKGDRKALVAVDHGRLGDVAESDRMKPYWRSALTSLKALLEEEARHA